MSDTSIQIGSEPIYCIPFCMKCCGQHPDLKALPSVLSYAAKLLSPHKDAMRQYKLYEAKRIELYSNKSCMVCGRTYDVAGEFNESNTVESNKAWARTASRVKEELVHAGLFSVADKQLELIVARCRKSSLFLIQNRFQINPKEWEKFTFTGCLTLIITHAQEARRKKVNPKYEGTVR